MIIVYNIITSYKLLEFNIVYVYTVSALFMQTVKSCVINAQARVSKLILLFHLGGAHNLMDTEDNSYPKSVSPIQSDSNYN